MDVHRLIWKIYVQVYIAGMVAEMTVTIEISKDRMVYLMRGCFSEIGNVSEEI